MKLPRRALLKALASAAASAATPRSLRALRTPDAPQAPSLIALNQVGYLPQSRKIATVVFAHSPVTPVPFRVRRQSSAAPAFEGTLSQPHQDPTSGDLICLADLSALTVPGIYHLEVSGLTSDPITIGPLVYAGALRLASRAFYGQRCGCHVDLGDGYQHPACHATGSFDGSSGRTGVLSNTGGWHDAGDYGRYMVNSGISTATLLWAWELFPGGLRQLALDLPKAHPHLPDFLAEIKWNLDWMLSLQDSADGGVWHKQTSLDFCAFVLPQDDHLPSAVIGTGAAPYKSTCASANLAAVMAIAARCFRTFDQTFAARCLAAARHAWQWSVANPSVIFRNPPSVRTGEYGDSHCEDEILWATAELFRTTREPAYEAALLKALTPPGQSLSATSVVLSPPSWSNLRPFALWTYALATRNHPTPGTPRLESPSGAIVEATQAAAAKLLEQAAQNGYGNTLSADDFHWGSNSNAANQSLLLLLANQFRPNPALASAALSNLHYLLGRNCFGVSWVTHLGARPYLHPHHRPSVADTIPAPWPGLLSGGPNALGGDEVAYRLPKLAPMKMWVDDQRAFSLNEVAINWNAPLVFLLAAANSIASPGTARPSAAGSPPSHPH